MNMYTSKNLSANYDMTQLKKSFLFKTPLSHHAGAVLLLSFPLESQTTGEWTCTETLSDVTVPISVLQAEYCNI